MDLYDLSDQVVALLQKRGRLAYRALKLQFQLDEEQLAALKEELLFVHPQVAEEEGRGLVWRESITVASAQLLVVSSSQPPAPQPADSGPQTPDVRRQTLHASRPEAERRQLTVMFCDLVGSTALSTQLDPEELREVVQTYQNACADVITSYAGHIAQYLGDGLLVYFGYPTAHEDDAQRAVRTGLGIIEALHDLNTQLSHPLQVRIGIHTGLVVVGEIGARGKREQLALGETPNIAARVQGLAEPDTLVISAPTHHLVAGLFDCQDLGSQVLKGLATPLRMYRVLGEGVAQSRFEVAIHTGLTPLVSRESEIGLLRDRWQQARQGAGQAVLLSGEPGIGKSRLVQTLREQVVRDGATRLELRCSPYHQNSAYYPIIEHLQRFLQFAPQDTPQTKLNKLTQTLSAYRLPQTDTLPLLAAFLSLPSPEGTPPLTLSPQKQKEKTQEVIVAWIVAEAERAPVYCVWEDLHWADPSTLDVLTLFLEQVPTSQLLTLLTFRPEFIPPWGPRSYLSLLTLSRLGRPAVEAMVEQVTRGKALPPEVLHQVVAKTDGVPLFVEELTKMVLESGLLREVGDHYELTGPLPPLAIPSTLHDSLMARLDRLEPVREIAQVGAVLGREFSYELLHAISPLDEGTLQQGLRQLVKTELVYQRGIPPQATYVFKHALVQDTAYQSLLKSKRQHYHQQLAQVLEARFSVLVEAQPELVAHHYTEAGLNARAIPYWQRAGERATQRSANPEAVAHFTKGLELVMALPQTPERDRQELALQIALGTPLIATKGYSGPEMAKTFARARELCDQVGDTDLVFPALYLQWGYHVTRREHQTAQEVAERFVELADRQGETGPRLVGHGLLGRSLAYRGEVLKGRSHIEQAFHLYDPQRHRHLAFHYGQDPHVANLAGLSWMLWMLGYPEQGTQRGEEAITIAHTLGHAHTFLYASNAVYGFSALMRRDVRVEANLHRAMKVLAEQGFSPMGGMLTTVLGWFRTLHESNGSGIAQILQGLAEMRAAALRQFEPYLLTLLADAYARSGQSARGLEVLAEALALVEGNDERFAEPELYRLKGELILQSQVSSPKHVLSLVEGSQVEAAEECFLKAIAIARQQQTKFWELRASTSLARLWRQQGKKEEARQLLAEIYGWFTEGFDTKDLLEAKALLEELSPSPL